MIQARASGVICRGRRLRQVAQGVVHSIGDGFFDAAADGIAGEMDPLADGQECLPIGVGQEHLRPNHVARRGGTATGPLVQGVAVGFG